MFHDLQVLYSTFNLASNITSIVNDTENASNVSLLYFTWIFKRVKSTQKEISSICWRIFLFLIDIDDVTAKFGLAHLYFNL